MKAAINAIKRYEEPPVASDIARAVAFVLSVGDHEIRDTAISLAEDYVGDPALYDVLKAHVTEEPVEYLKEQISEILSAPEWRKN